MSTSTYTLLLLIHPVPHVQVQRFPAVKWMGPLEAPAGCTTPYPQVQMHSVGTVAEAV